MQPHNSLVFIPAKQNNFIGALRRLFLSLFLSQQFLVVARYLWVWVCLDLCQLLLLLVSSAMVPVLSIWKKPWRKRGGVPQMMYRLSCTDRLVNVWLLFLFTTYMKVASPSPSPSDLTPPPIIPSRMSI